MGKYGPDKNPYLDTSHIVLETIDLRENSRNFYEGISSRYLFPLPSAYSQSCHCINSHNTPKPYFVKSVRIRSFSGPNAGKYGPKKL